MTVELLSAPTFATSAASLEALRHVYQRSFEDLKPLGESPLLIAAELRERAPAPLNDWIHHAQTQIRPRPRAQTHALR
jgi:hypothetical protein